MFYLGIREKSLKNATTLYIPPSLFFEKIRNKGGYLTCYPLIPIIPSALSQADKPLVLGGWLLLVLKK